MYLFQQNLDSWIFQPRGGDKHFNIVHAHVQRKSFAKLNILV